MTEFLRALHGPDQLVQLELHRRGVAVLGVLDQEDHQEGDDRGAGVDDQLPGVAEVEDRARSTAQTTMIPRASQRCRDGPKSERSTWQNG